MNAELIDYMGNDLSVVNAARVSMDKKSEFTCCRSDGEGGTICTGECCGGDYDYPQLSDQDSQLISYLAKHNHWTPFAHTAITLRMKAPIFVRTQCFKHKAGFVENEVSRRYVDSEPEMYTPDVWRNRPDGSIKQGSGSTMGPVNTSQVEEMYANLIEYAERTYNNFLDLGMAPEQARMVLPQSMYTEWMWTGNIASFARFCKQRTDPHAQQEIRELAQQVSDIIQPLFPISWEALMENEK